MNLLGNSLPNCVNVGILVYYNGVTGVVLNAVDLPALESEALVGNKCAILKNEAVAGEEHIAGLCALAATLKLIGKDIHRILVAYYNDMTEAIGFEGNGVLIPLDLNNLEKLKFVRNNANSNGLMLLNFNRSIHCNCIFTGRNNRICHIHIIVGNHYIIPCVV